MGINYSSFILVEEENAKNISATESTATAVRKKPEAEYIIEGISGPDMIITKKTTRKHEQFVMLVSQEQAYIKDLKSETITKVNPDILNAFFAQLEEPLKCVDSEGNALNWTDYFYRGMKFARVLDKILSYKDLVPYMKKGLFFHNFEDMKEDDVHCNSAKYPIKIVSQLYEMIPNKYKKAYIAISSQELLSKWYCYSADTREAGLDEYDTNKIRTLIRDCTQDWEEVAIYKYFGISGVRRFVEEYFQTAVSYWPPHNEMLALLSGSNRYSYSARPVYNTKFELNNLIQYVLYSSVEQGYANEIKNFLELWKDTLAMESVIYKHGIKDKYPESLATTHQILSYKYSLIEQQINEELWNNHVAEMEKYERHGEHYIIIAPKNPDDMIDEARQQSNCLSSYVRRVIEGSCKIFFLRKTKEPDKSLVTIEIREDGSLGQVKAKYNREPSDEAMDYINKWYREKFLKKGGEE